MGSTVSASTGPGIASQAAGAGAALADGSSPNGTLTAAEPATTAPASLAGKVAADGVRFILATFVDLNGKPCAKLVPAEAVGMLASDGVGFAGYAAGALGQ